MSKASRTRRQGTPRPEKRPAPKAQLPATLPTDQAGSSPPTVASDERVTVVAIGASAGGLAALKTFFAHVPKDSGVAYVVIVHLSPAHESHLEELLQPHVAIPVVQVTTTVALEPNHVYVIPPNANLEAADTHLRLAAMESRRRARAPIDHFFRTLAETHDGRAVGIVLTGTGSDGALGLRWIKEHGGLAVVQDPADAEYDGMPKNALALAPVDLVLPLTKIPPAVLRFAQTEPRLVVPGEDAALESGARKFLRGLFAVILARTGRDFSRYKRSTLLRRIARRMQFNHVQEPSAYLELLRKQPGEVSALTDDLLIKVTSFFRDSDVFAALEKAVIPKLLEGKGPSDSVRAWSVGSATGEEAYSIAMLLLEEATRRASPAAIQVFATDLHQQSLGRAREALYPDSIEADVSPSRLQRFFVRDDGGYRVRREVRDLLVFSQHNVLADPPFSRLDLISCRNLLIYLDRELHKEVAALFHYALRPEGYLLLGTSEIASTSELFAAEDKKHSIYRRLNAPAPEPRLPVFSSPRLDVPGSVPPLGLRHEPFAYGPVHQRLVEQYAPPSVLLSPDDQVVHFSAHAGRYLLHPGGAPTTSVFKLVRDELRVELKTVVTAVRAQRKAIRTRPIAVRFDDREHPVVLDVRPALDPEQEGFLLLIFDERPPAEAEEVSIQPTSTAEDLARIQGLEAGKETADQRLRQVIKEYETGQEELRATNEELQSANEELRSTLEELEASKEELQSMNEELQTVNQENHHKVEELSQLSSDLQNLFAATDIATIFLDRELRILRFTPRSTDLFNVRATDRGRPLSDFTHRLGYEDLQADAEQVLAQLVPIEREVHDKAGRWYLMRVRPYRDTRDRIAGVVVTFVEVTELKKAEDALRRAKEEYERIIEILPEPLLLLTSDLRVRAANVAFYEHFKVTPAETQGRNVYDLGNGQWNIPALRELLEKVLPENEVFTGYQVDHLFEGLGRRVMLVSGRHAEQMQLILVGITDITERSAAEQALRSSEERLRRMINVEGVGVLTFDQNGTLVSANDTFLKMSGYSREDVEHGALSWRSLTPPEYVELSEQQREKLEETGAIGPYEKEYKHKDGSRSWMLFTGAALGDGTTVEYCIDVSDRKRAEEVLKRSHKGLERLAKASLHVMALTDLGALLQAIAEAALALTGARLATCGHGYVSGQYVVGGSARVAGAPACPPGNMFQLDKGGVHMALVDGHLDSIRLTDAELRVHERWWGLPANHVPMLGLLGARVPPRAGGVTSGVILVTNKEQGDFTQEDEALLRQLATVASLALQHVEARIALEESDRRKNHFLAMLSHELRNPLAPIRNSLYILDRSKPGGEQALRAQSIIDRQVGHLTRLVDDLLDVTRVSRGKIQLQRERLDLCEVVRRAVEDYRDTFTQNRVALETSFPGHPLWVEADRTRIAQVIGNLLSNSAKFTPPGGETVVSVEENRSLKQATLRVRDTGVGITQDVLPRIFEAFSQADTTLHRSKGGLGLGLALVKGLVEMHGGTASVESEGAGNGTEFTIRLPLAHVQAPAVVLPRGPLNGGSRRVLVIEDNVDAAESLREVLELGEHTVEVAASGGEGIEKARSFRPEVVLCDIGLPGMDGFEVARAMRADPMLRETRLVALTGYAAPEDVARAREAGFDAHLAKPPSFERLEEALSLREDERPGLGPPAGP